MKKTTVMTIVLSIVFYFIFLTFYLVDFIDALGFLGVLFLGILMLGILLLIFRKKRILKRISGTSILVLSLLFAYEFTLLFYLSAPSYISSTYVPPIESVAGSGIFSVGVGELKFEEEEKMNKESINKLLTEQGVDVLSIAEIDNHIIYGVKTRQLLSWLHLTKEHTPKEMVETVSDYLGAEGEWLTKWDRSGSNGDSAGLSLALSGLYISGKLENQVPIAVTGGITTSGKVTKVGSIQEKLQIIEKAGISFALMPNKNKREAQALQKDLKSKVSVIYVSNVKEAQLKIEELNRGQ
ncbi:S16 family serine protease [Sporosarcina sp. SAFN-010]|uniref:S16 family serine protease n=1 Tax=Sporosarcina sp. SAFN-010 TaxID=3387273 RepID=UPI003F7E12ED